jgi:hypothetical protein
MFFDDLVKDTEYQELMVSIAKKQNTLLQTSFDWERRSSKKKAKRRGLFARPQSESPAVSALKQELEALKAEAETCRVRHAYRQGLFWWNLPWEQVEEYLIYDLEDIREDGSWRFARSWECEKQDGMCLLFLKEEGHFSSFSTSANYETSIISPYSQAEIDEKISAFNHRMTMYDLAVTGSISGPVHSVLSGIDYDSGMDYLLSAENFMVRDQLQDNYKRTLYTEHETTTVYAESHSRHYKSIYLVGEYHINGDGILDHVGISNYSLIKSDGSIPSGIREYYDSLDAAVGCAAYLTDQHEVRKVPLALFGKDITSPAGSYYEALRQAKLYTCLADKIIFD